VFFVDVLYKRRNNYGFLRCWGPLASFTHFVDNYVFVTEKKGENMRSYLKWLAPLDSNWENELRI